jgi:hypothetical protein
MNAASAGWGFHLYVSMGYVWNILSVPAASVHAPTPARRAKEPPVKLYPLLGPLGVRGKRMGRAGGHRAM